MTSPEGAQVISYREAVEEFQETTDQALFVRTSNEDLAEWDRQKIIDALIRETMVDAATAESISLQVEEQIRSSSIQTLTAPLIRELVNAKLVEQGLERVCRKHSRLGVPLYDVEQLILHPNKENANVPHGPEATNLTLAESIKKEYALLNVFPQEVADAHVKGDFHLHDLGFIDRPYCSGQSLEYVKKFGLNLPNALSMAGPAKHPEVLLAHMVKFAAALQSHFAGAIGWDAVNIFFAPYLEGMSDREVTQLAQMLIFEFSQQAVARGGQAIFTDINLYWEVPEHFENVPAIGPGGQYTGRTYSDYIGQSQRFLKALFEVYLEGDGSGRPFFFPKPLVHMTEKFFRTPGHEEFLHMICEVASEKGNTYFVFDRGNTAKISQCCRLSFKLEESDLEDAKQPWKMRYCALQNVTVNLPRIGIRAQQSERQMFEKIEQMMELCARAHLAKRDFIQMLLDVGENGPLALLSMNRDGSPYLRMPRATYLIGMLGLNELVQVMTGQELHESQEAYKYGLRIIAYMKLVADRLSERHKMRFILEQSPAESTAHRLAKLDLKYYPAAASEVVKGDVAAGTPYYTNSTLYNVGCLVSPIERVRDEGRFHPLIPAGSISHLWMGEQRPDPASLASFVIKVFRHTKSDQVAFSPELTTCNSCGATERGIKERCSACGSKDVDAITRITGYFTKVSSWNAGKRGELRERYRNNGFFESAASTAALRQKAG